MPISVRRIGFQIAMCGVLAAPAVAADPSPEQAKSLEAQMQAALAGTFGSLTPSPDRPVRFVAQGDHYDVSVPLGAGGQAMTGTAKQGPGGIWAINGITFPSPADFAFNAPKAAARAGGPGEVHVSTKVAEQDASAVFDPSYATASSFMGKYRAMRVELEGLQQHQVQHFDAYTVTLGNTAAVDGKIDVSEAVDVTGYSNEAHSLKGPDLHVAAQHLGLQAHAAALSVAQAAATAQAMAAFYGTAMSAVATGKTPSWTAPDKAAAHHLVEALQNVFAGFDITQTVDALQVNAGSAGASVDHATFGLTASAPADMLSAHLDLSIAGLSVPAVTPAMGGDLIPHHLSLRPVLSGISMHDVSLLALSATEPDTDFSDIMIQVAALFTHGGIGLGLENFSVDIGPAQIAGAVHAKVTGLQKNSGEGRITATGFDALIARLKQLPDAKDLLPTMDTIRQLARSDGDTLVWDMTLQNTHLLVNGVDVFGMAKTRKL